MAYTKYDNFKFMYPPRPEYVTSPDQLDKYEKSHIGQPKLNGSCCLIFIKGKEFKYYNRHGKPTLTGFKLKINDLEVLNCGNDKWNVIVGEYMNKSQTGLDGKVWNHKFVIFDILVYNGEYLLGSTFEERLKLLDSMFGTVDENEYLYKVNENVYRVKSFRSNFLETWNKITTIGMLEGWVLKKPDAKLERGLSEKNNTLWQLKSRKSTLNYRC
jgi:hypothetical protein